MYIYLHADIEAGCSNKRQSSPTANSEEHKSLNWKCSESH